MKTIVPVASGKGGVGKTVLTANLGVSLAQLGKTVIAVDLDLGGSNLHTCLGVRNNKSGVGQLISKEEPSLESLIVETQQPRLYFVPGDSLLPGTANLAYFRKRSILKELNDLVADFVLLDLGSGSSYNVVDFYLSSPAGLMVITPDTTSVLNAYSFLKTTVFRLLYRSFPRKSRERELIAEFFRQRLEGSDRSLSQLLERLAEVSRDSEQIARERIEGFLPRVVLNMARRREDLAVGKRLRSVSGRHLEIDVRYVGVLAMHEDIGASIAQRTPELLLRPDSGFARGIRQIAERLAQSPGGQYAELFEGDEDLEEAAQHAEL
jgi:flagellar biosynthesis protein FlhG